MWWRAALAPGSLDYARDDVGLMDFRTPLPPLTRNQRLALWAMALLAAATRFLAMARSLWDWDETLFCLGMRSYDVTSHHPHPPGFPVYIALGHIAHLFTRSDFRALQMVNLIAAMLLFPAVFMLARELRLRFDVAFIAASLCVFLPNVWFFGGGAFSDIPSLTLVVFGAAMLFRGSRDAEAYLVGAFLLALAIGIRPQNALIGIVPGAISTWHRLRARAWRDVLFAALLGMTVVGLAFGEAAWATGGLDRYANSIAQHRDYIMRIDSFHAPGRPPLWRLFDRFFIKQYGSPVLSVITSVFVLVAIIGAIRVGQAPSPVRTGEAPVPHAIGILALTFAPFAIMAWLMLDRFSVTRFSIGYIPMFAILAADGIRRLARNRVDLTLVAGGALTLVFFFWTLPALTPVRTQISPPVAAVRAAQQHLDPSRDHLFVAFNMTPFVEYFAPSLQFTRVMDDRAMPLSYGAQRPWLLAEDESMPRSGYVDRRERGHLWDIARRHYFECSVEPMTRLAQFGDGWYLPERNGIDEWRWTAQRAVTTLPPATGLTKLRLLWDTAGELVPLKPVITIRLNGVVLDRFTATSAHFEHDYKVEPRPNGAPNVLELETTKTLKSGDDPRDLGLQVRYLSWGPD